MASLSKLSNPAPVAEFVGHLMSWRPSDTLVRGLGVLEWSLGVTLLAGLYPMLVRAATGGLLVMFVVLLGFVEVWGTADTCPCLGLDTSIPLALGRNGLLLCALVAAIVLDRGVHQVERKGNE